MFVRLVLSGLLVCGLVSCDLAAAAKNGSGVIVKGRTAQGYPIKVKLQGKGKLRLIHFKADLNCRDGSILELTESGFLPTPIRRGKFHESQYGSTDTVYFRGTVKRGKVKGRVRLTDTLGKKKIPCKSKWISFRAS